MVCFHHFRNEDSAPQESPIFGSRSSLFQRLNDSPGRSFRTVDQSERITRLLPNPFSSTIGRPQASRTSSSESVRTSPRNVSNTSRTSIFTSSRRPDFLRRRRNSSPSQHSPGSNRANSSSSTSHDAPSTSTARPSSSYSESMPSTSRGTGQRPTMTNSSTQMSPSGAPVDAQSINESLDLIRDILRDSGTRLLNLITNMSLSTLASVERSIPRRSAGSRAHSDESEGSTRSRGGMRPRVRLFSSNLRRDVLSSTSDSDSDQSLEVNIFRTRNSSFREDESRDSDQPNSNTARADRTPPPTDRMEFDINHDRPEEETTRDNSGIDVMLGANSGFRVRFQNPPNDEPQPSTSASARERDQAASARSQAPDSSDRPSTSRETFWTRGYVVPPDEAYRKVRGGVTVLQKHTMQLTNMWLRGSRVTMRELRTIWENLRRRILMLHRETGRQDLPSYYTRSLLERCMMLSEMSDNLSRTNRSPRSQGTQRSEESDRRAEESDMPTNPSPGNSNSQSGANAPAESANDSRPSQGPRSPQTRPTGSRPTRDRWMDRRRMLSAAFRWRPEDEIRRRNRNPTTNRLTPRYSNRSRRDLARAIEISATRHQIRMRAMQVLSVMFNMMMMCLEERGLSQLIINMLRTLKKALALTCLMLMTNRHNARANNNPAPASQRVDSLNVVRIENVEHPGPVNVDGPDDPSSPRVTNEPENDNSQKTDKNGEKKKPENDNADVPSGSKPQGSTEAPPSTTVAQRWSNRLAVQIAAANRNNSATARNRRELYIESRRLKALHRTNPSAHPMNKRRALPPVSTYRIPALRSWTSKNKVIKPTVRNEPANNEPVAGPSNASPPADNANQESPRSEVMNEFEHRVNLIRIAHLQAIRLRNAARNRFRRLQTIRVYTPSSVREMFTLQNPDSQAENRPSPNGPELGNRRPFATYHRPHILTPRSGESSSRGSEEPGQFHTVLNNVAMPLMQVNDQLVNPEAPGGQQQRLPRIHEYLQPIILAQVNKNIFF